jgi:hypothetical protein
VSKALDHGVGSREYEANMPIVGPLDEVGRNTLSSVDLQDLRIAIVFTLVVGLDDKSVSDTCLHCSAFLLIPFTMRPDVLTSPGPLVLI